jgi:hypothetical protein
LRRGQHELRGRERAPSARRESVRGRERSQQSGTESWRHCDPATGPNGHRAFTNNRGTIRTPNRNGDL